MLRFSNSVSIISSSNGDVVDHIVQITSQLSLNTSLLSATWFHAAVKQMSQNGEYFRSIIIIIIREGGAENNGHENVGHEIAGQIIQC